MRAAFLDPRRGGFHGGVDISVRDDRPEEGAPEGHTHRVFALDGGTVAYDAATMDLPCAARVVSVGHFSYGHVDPVGTVAVGETVAPGQQIGWTCTGQWHVHLTEWQTVAGQLVRVNPLRPDGKLAPYVDTAAPVIHDVRFFELPDWSIEHLMPWFDDGAVQEDSNVLRDVVDVRASITDPQSFGGWYGSPALGRLRNEVAPYRLHVTVTRFGARRPAIDRDVFRADVSLSLRAEPERRPLPFGSVYAPGTTLTLGADACLAPAQAAACQGVFWYRVFATTSSRYWDTTRYPNGRYRIALTAWDAAGNATTGTTVVRLANDRSAGRRPS